MQILQALRQKRSGAVAAILMALIVMTTARGAVGSAFPPPAVNVYLSTGEPGGHPDLQVVIDQPSGLGFDQVKISGPPNGSVASDAEIPNFSIIGRLDASATTNAIVLPQCGTRVTFSVPIRKVSADPTSPGYPSFLNTLAPGKHRLRLIADVSPSASVSVVLTYLLDIDPATQSVVARIFVGDPTRPPAQFQSCTPQSSVNTLFGVAPNGAPFLTAPPTGSAPFPFTFSFTSKPDGTGARYTQQVNASAGVRVTDRAVLGADIPSCVVWQVIDGNSFICGGPGGTTVRLMETSAPALDACGGAWAKAALEFIFLPVGRAIRLDYGTAIEDGNGAIQAAPIATGTDGVDYNMSVVMVYVGLARASSLDGNTKYADWLAGADVWARVAQWNMWAPDGPFNGATTC